MEYLKQMLFKSDHLHVKSSIICFFFFLFLYMAWKVMPLLLSANYPTVGLVDAGIWQLLLFATICFVALLSLCILLLKFFLATLALPSFPTMVSQLNHLTSWQQLRLYWASFALLFLGALLSLAAIF
jgi:hypothetical protein